MNDFHLSDFDGPLDLLLRLIGEAKVDIRDIFVSEVTGQYLQIVGDADLGDVDEASEFIRLAATLVLIKSRAILPVEEDEMGGEDPGEALIRQLEEYARVREAAESMKGLEEAAAKLFTKLPEEFPLPPPEILLDNLSPDALMAAFRKVLQRAAAQEDAGDGGQNLIYLDAYSVSRCMGAVLRAIRKGSVAFSSLFCAGASRGEVVTLFLALLELLRRGKIAARQDAAGEEITIGRPVAGVLAHGA